MLSFCMASFEASQFEVSQPQPLLKAICDRVSAAFGILCNNRFASHSVILILSMLCLAAPATGQIVVKNYAAYRDQRKRFNLRSNSD